MNQEVFHDIFVLIFNLDMALFISFQEQLIYLKREMSAFEFNFITQIYNNIVIISITVSYVNNY